MSLISEKDFTFDHERAQATYIEVTSGKDALSPADAHDVAQAAGEPWGVHYTFPSRRFLCYERLALPFVFWASEQNIGLHIACAQRLIKALERDLIEHRHGRDFAQAWYARVTDR